MAEKKTFVIRIDAPTYDAIEKWAGDEFRSVNGQMEWLINRALKEAGRTVKKDNSDKPDKQEKK